MTYNDELGRAVERLEGTIARYPREPRARTDKADLRLILTALRKQGEAGIAAYRACQSAWSCGEPRHRVEAMIDAIDALGVALGEPGAASPNTQAREGEG